MSRAAQSLPDFQQWISQSRLRLDKIKLAPEVELIGQVERVADGVARISGLATVGLNELLNFEQGQAGLVLSMDPDCIHAVILNDIEKVKAGDRVSGSRGVIKVPVGDGLLGRTVDPLGQPLDDQGQVIGSTYLAIERAAPAIMHRQLISTPLATGVLVVDGMFALGRGQRELIVGDRATGKTSLAVDVMINQKHSDVICVYVAIGQRAVAVERVLASLRKYGNIDRCVTVVAGPSSAPGLQWVAPFAAMSMAEYFRDKGEHVLIVFDDLTKHAATHRELALLTNEPPGREAYPGDIFYLHARLLERAAAMSADYGGGSLTALPIAQTEAGKLSAYIPTNLISITDGQIVLNSRLFAANLRPAVDVGLSVSRLGGKAQSHAMKLVAGRVRLDYAQFLELESFTRFGGMPDERVKNQIIRGEHIRALLCQPRYETLRTIDEIALLAALGSGVMDSLPVELMSELRNRIKVNLDTQANTIVHNCANGRMPETEELKILIMIVRNIVEELAAETEKDRL